MEERDLTRTFVNESTELVEALEQGFVELESEGEGDKTAAVHRLFRVAHTLKGNAGMLGLSTLVELTHTLENVLARVREGALGIHRPLIDAFLGANDVITKMVWAVAAGQPLEEIPGVEAAIEALVAQGGDDTAPVRVAQRPPVLREVEVTMWLTCAEEERAAVSAQAVADLSAIAKALAPPASEPGQPEVVKLRLSTDLRHDDLRAAVMFYDVEVNVADVTPQAPAAAPHPTAAKGAAKEPSAQQASKAAPAGAKAGSAMVADVVRVDRARLDALIDFGNELVIAAAQARQVINGAQSTPAERAEAAESLFDLVTTVQERLMALRMVPVRETFERFRRPVRDLARELGKEIELETEGGAVELDRRLLDALVDPLKHMVRNACAHGLESAEAREAAGKPRAGTITLSATQTEGGAVLEVRDDGGGIDQARVLAKAIEKGIVDRDAQLRESEIYDLLFAPGFSTAATIDEVSGRGVGLDVVRQNVEALRGRIEIRSERGRGTTFRIRVPMTVGVVEGMQVSVGSQRLTIPLPSIVELLDVRTHRIGALAEHAEYVDLRGETVPVLPLGALLGAGEARRDDGTIVVVRGPSTKFGVLVDRVDGIARSLVKSLERSFAFLRRVDGEYRRPAALGSATVLVDGSIGWVLDVDGLESMARAVA